MQTFRSRLSRIKKHLEQLPDGPDVYGFSGVSKDLLVKEIDSLYGLSQFISEHEAEPFAFEVIALKRASSRFYQQYKELFDAEDGAPRQESFDEFLNGLTTLVEKTKVVCSLMSNDGFMPAAVVGNLKEEAKQFKACFDLYSKELESAKEAANEFASAKASIEDSLKTITDLTDECETLRTNARKHAGDIGSAHEEVLSWKEEIEKTNEASNRANEAISKNRTSIESQKTQIDDTVLRSNQLLKEIETENEQSKRLLDEAKETLGNTNRVSMAASFKERKRQLTPSLFIWGGLFVVTVLGLAYCANYLFANATGAFNWSQFLLRIAVMSPLVWLGWYSARQYGFTIRLKEDYAYKYAVSVAYEGFKKAVGETDEKLQELLLELSMFNMANSPMRVFTQKNNGVKGLPLEEALEAIQDQFKSLKKITFNPQTGSITAEMAGLATENSDEKN